jgi:hypothetical protein
MTDGLEDIGLPPIGHNKPPELTAIERTPELIDNCNRWLAERPEVTDPEMAGAAQRFTLQLRALRDDLDKELRSDRRPHDDAIAVIKAAYLDPQQLVEIALVQMEKRNRGWLKREQDRLDAERAERQRQADEAKRKTNEALEQAAAKPSVEAELAAQRALDAEMEAKRAAQRAPTRARTRDDYASKAMSLHSRWKARVIDERAALKHYAKHPAIRAAALAAIVKVATDLAKDQKGKPPVPPGVEFWNDERAV